MRAAKASFGLPSGWMPVLPACAEACGAMAAASRRCPPARRTRGVLPGAEAPRSPRAGKARRGGALPHRLRVQAYAVRAPAEVALEVALVDVGLDVAVVVARADAE